MAATAESTQIFRRVIEPERGTFPRDLARYVLDLDFPGEDHAGYEALSAKAQEGTLTAQEADELDGYLHVDGLPGHLAVEGRTISAGAGRPGP